MRTETELGHVFRLQAQKLGGHLVAYGIFFTVIALGVVIGFPVPGALLVCGKRDAVPGHGAPTIVLIMTALVVVPMQNATARVAGYIDFIKSPPVSRKNFLFADFNQRRPRSAQAGDRHLHHDRAFYVPPRVLGFVDDHSRLCAGGDGVFRHRLRLLVRDAG